MKTDLPQRTQMLFDRMKHFPEAGRVPGGFVMREDAFAAFLELRQLVEREILPALDELRRMQQG